MKYAKLTVRQIKDFWNKPSIGATRKFISTQEFQKVDVENSQLKMILVPFNIFEERLRSIGRSREISTVEIIEDSLENFEYKYNHIDKPINREIEGELVNNSTMEYRVEDAILTSEFLESLISELSQTKEIAGRVLLLEDQQKKYYEDIESLKKEREYFMVENAVMKEKLTQLHEKLNDYKVKETKKWWKKL